MKKYVKEIDQTKKCIFVFEGTDENWAIKNGYEEKEVEQAYTGSWYLMGHAPQKPEPSYAEKRLAEYPSFGDQLDMIYWDKVNGSNFWQEKITEIKNKYPKN